MYLQLEIFLFLSLFFFIFFMLENWEDASSPDRCVAVTVTAGRVTCFYVELRITSHLASWELRPLSALIGEQQRLGGVNSGCMHCLSH